MRQVRVKICGITREEDLAVAVAAGADAVGFVVGAPLSPRNVSLEKAEKLISLVPIFVDSVLVMVPTSTDELSKTCKKLNPNSLQIHGENLPGAFSLRDKLSNTHLIRAVSANHVSVIKVAADASKLFDAILIDTCTDGKYGGTGVTHDWELSKRVRQIIHPMPLILAGGLSPENIRDAVNTVQPYAVDVSSGVEQKPGFKDERKVMEFIKNAKDVRI